ncbi:hypothetical protein PCLA_05f0145 [Pseudomonas citronellolis]|nr:hypothetical protein PCLA_05f0145 [Pseudomonas citronellolis]
MSPILVGATDRTPWLGEGLSNGCAKGWGNGCGAGMVGVSGGSVVVAGAWWGATGVAGGWGRCCGGGTVFCGWCLPVAGVQVLMPFPLPNPLPEGRGDRSACADISALAGLHRVAG